MGQPQHKKSPTVFDVLHRDGKPVTFLSNTLVVTVTQDGSKCEWQQQAHLANARSFVPKEHL